MFISALLIGFLGSMHCVAMCSPITLMLGNANKTSQFVLQRINYNTGRVVGYALLGAIAGIFGKILSLTGLQQWFSIGFGVLIIIVVILFDSSIIYNPSYKPLQKFILFIRTRFSVVQQSQSKIKGFIIGLLNGFLPCGLVYMAIIGAVTMDSIFEAILYMIVFGLGTWPMMLFVAFSGGMLAKKSNIVLLKIVPIVIAILFIVRGLGLGIPYLSPKFEEKGESPSNITECVSVK
ncbi:MAG: sulfite exporter TauE/SafE family protein [Cyclobacteriaceae bacterium]|nr:sulfite exporter TauE/SafE family protein [Cyclobacteriaceae bacterium]